MSEKSSHFEGKFKTEIFLISRASILILSGFLIGMVASRAVVPGTELTVLAAALTGILSYGVLDHISRRREQGADDEACRPTA